MANNLDRQIEDNEIVILYERIFKEEYKPLKFRLYRCHGGSGMQNYTMGSAIYGEFVSDNEKCRYEGDEDIDADETNKIQAIIGKFGENTDELNKILNS